LASLERSEPAEIFGGARVRGGGSDDRSIRNQTTRCDVALASESIAREPQLPGKGERSWRSQSLGAREFAPGLSGSGLRCLVEDRGEFLRREFAFALSVELLLDEITQIRQQHDIE